MNDNEKAAIAAGLWEPGQRTNVNLSTYAWHTYGAPDMHLPENLWRALENRNADIIPSWTINGGEGTWSVEMYLGHSVQLAEGGLGARLIEIERPTLVEVVFAALVVFYDAERPNG